LKIVIKYKQHIKHVHITTTLMFQEPLWF